VRVEGAVQGVGFRPFVHGLATRLGLAGHVGNDATGVFAEVEGDPAAAEELVAALRTEAPPLAVVDAVTTTPLPPTGERGFRILPSRPGTVPTALVSPDTATCDDCLREMADPVDRRYRYPFINCTNCGPRFTIVRGIPYDRPLTTMAGFVMCPACRREYDDPGDRRFHAQPVCCPACGPRLSLVTATGTVPGDAIRQAADRLRKGEVLAVKGLGGFHLAVLAADDAAARRLRSRKHREDKPFAVMVADLHQAAALCRIDHRTAALLGDRRRPIVLLPRRDDAPVAGAVAPGNRQLGLMLPYTPVHHLLLAEVGAPLVMTSGNLSEEPIAYRDDDLARLWPVAEAALTHDRPIHTRCDDSVVRPHRDSVQLLRRSRGFAPHPVRLRDPLPAPVLGCGAELKSTFCLGRDRQAFVSHHIGDLENVETMHSFTEGIAHFERLFEIEPAAVAHDLHPDYLSTQFAHDLADEHDLPLVGVQHHHAHIAACLADNQETGPVIGVAFDGTGYGEDGTIWGGELLLADVVSAQRLGHLAPVRMPGGTTAIRQPWRLAIAHLDATGLLDDDLELPVLHRHAADWPAVRRLAHTALAPTTTSVGRLFDAVAALLDVRDTINYEGQAAVELEQLADPAEPSGYPMHVDTGETLVLHGADLVRHCVDELAAGVDRPVIAARFHHGLALATARACREVRDRTGLDTVALSGGVFQSLLLTDRLVDRLEEDGFRVLTHHQVPTNDGGISLGQVVVAGARCRAGLTPRL
jgi:hydrogenase maturation protein HypF